MSEFRLYIAELTARDFDGLWEQTVRFVVRWSAVPARRRRSINLWPGYGEPVMIFSAHFLIQKACKAWGLHGQSWFAIVTCPCPVWWAIRTWIVIATVHLRGRMKFVRRHGETSSAWHILWWSLCCSPIYFPRGLTAHKISLTSSVGYGKCPSTPHQHTIISTAFSVFIITVIIVIATAAEGCSTSWCHAHFSLSHMKSMNIASFAKPKGHVC